MDIRLVNLLSSLNGIAKSNTFRVEQLQKSEGNLNIDNFLAVDTSKNSSLDPFTNSLCILLYSSSTVVGLQLVVVLVLL